MGIPVRLEVFEGPLDLLLHLIDKNKVNIYDIPIVMITEQYMEYIKSMETKDLDVMSEFLVMAATLLNIKSKSIYLNYSYLFHISFHKFLNTVHLHFLNMPFP